MMRTSVSGFHYAPISKGLLWLTAGSSILASVTNSLTSITITNFYQEVVSKFQVWKLVTNHFVFSSPGELLFGLILIYYFRVFERQMGSSKFGAFVCISVALSTLLQVSFLTIFPSFEKPVSGPYAIIFACFMLFYLYIPASARFKLLGINLSDKVFTYLLGIQLLCSHMPLSVVAGSCGLLSGIAYLSNTLPLNRIRWPQPVVRFCSRFLYPLLKSSPPHRPSRTSRTGRQRTVLFPPQMQTPTDTTHPAHDFVAGSMPAGMEVDVTEEHVDQLVNMGFERSMAVRALRHSHNNIELATHMLLNE
jgi:membrane associated rhomboid family serine protease